MGYEKITAKLDETRKLVSNVNKLVEASDKLTKEMASHAKVWDQKAQRQQLVEATSQIATDLFQAAGDAKIPVLDEMISKLVQLRDDALSGKIEPHKSINLELPPDWHMSDRALELVRR